MLDGLQPGLTYSTKRGTSQQVGSELTIGHYIEPSIDSPALRYQVTQRQIEHSRVLEGCLYVQRMKLLQMEPVQQVLARIRCEVDITTASLDVLEDLPTSECDLVSDDDDEGEGGEVESIPDETDYEGNLLDEYETVMAVQEQRVEADVELVLNEYDSVIIEREEAPLSGEIEASPSD